MATEKPISVKISEQAYLTTSASVLFCILMPVYFTVGEQHWSRQAVYIIPIMLALGSVARGKFRVSLIPLIFIFLHAVAYGVLAFSGEDVSRNEFIFVSLSLLAFAFPFVTPFSFPKMLLLAGAAYVCISLVFGEAGSIQFVAGGKGAFETSFGLSLPLLMIVFYVQKKRVLLIITSVICLLMFKRIAILAVITCISIDFLIRLLPGVRLQRTFWVVSASTVLILAVAFALQSPYAFEILSDVLASYGTYLSPNNISSGRYNATLSFYNAAYSERSVAEWLVGDGSGASSTYVRRLPEFDGSFQLLHNDFLRVLTDYGLFGLGATLCVMFLALKSRDRIVALSALYTVLLFMTDNVATYLYYWLTLAFLLRVPRPIPPEPAEAGNLLKQDPRPHRPRLDSEGLVVKA